MKPILEWCEINNVPLPHMDANKKMPKRVRCKKCKKNFRPTVKDCGDGHCYHASLPKHKRRVN